MNIIRRIAMTTAATGIGVALAVGPAAAAFADGPDTSQRTVQKIEGQPWVEFKEGDADYRIESARCFFDYLDYTDNCDPRGEGGDIFTEELTEGVKAYQEDEDLPVTGNLDAETWSRLMDDIVNVQRGDTRVDVVRGVQEALNHVGDAGLTVDGKFGSGTETAVKEFQTAKEIDADGIVGPLTFRAMFDSSNPQE